MGDKQGPLVSFNWVPASLFPGAIPWLILLGLLLLPRNREANAWWVAVPVICCYPLQALLRIFAHAIPGQPWDWFATAANALAFCLAAVWLLADHLAWKHRFRAFASMFFLLAIFGALALACVVDWDDSRFELPVAAAILGISTFALSASLALAGWLCRRQYRPLRLLILIGALNLVCSCLVVAPIYLIMVLATGQTETRAFFSATLSLAGVTCCVLLPFIVLSFINEFYRERLKGLLNLGQLEPRPMRQVPTQAVLAAVGPQQN